MKAVLFYRDGEIIDFNNQYIMTGGEDIEIISKNI
jgi:hypothetical protein